ncbi:glucose 1-dehydrogenase [Flaviramulus sp. BrNp1-15]|uniref:SDR family NAD(P)-dependent oxidoreductase n=1 Tax=Flaviramulus sp. BrNp1-15 TaxID=2916754 RepID=UPI001EE86EFE|nr:glucose 1-dehydrogenase [Flaviramulus sp. BrNp1-15]ULC58046.1 glucose 1-dehydrogenase [Flaviramulus sp. BrNp1-15]
MKFSLKNKTAIVTGGASGIGKAISQTFAEQGAYVHILELNVLDGQSFVNKLIDKGLKASIHKCNVAIKAEVDTVINNIAKASEVDILINNAGIAHVGNIENTEESDLDNLYQVNIKGVYNCIKAVIPFMKKQNSGVIINMASIASTVAVAERFAYSMTKGAVLTMTYSIAKDYITNGIRCNSISPARVYTPFVEGFIKKNYPGKEQETIEALSKTQPIGRMGKPEEVADLALYLCSDEASFITGTDFPIDGGFIKLNG